MFGHLRKQQPLESLHRGDRSVDSLPCQHPVDVDEITGEILSNTNTLPFSDPRVDVLIEAAHSARVDAVDRPLPPESLPHPDDDQRSVRVEMPILPEDKELKPWEYSLPLPVSMFVAAPEITDWKKGRDGEKNGQSSARVIRDYTHQAAETAPPINSVTVYVRHDGAMFAALDGDGAHRLCAAKQRGDIDIWCTNVRFVVL